MYEKEDDSAGQKGVLKMDCQKFQEYLYPFLDKEIDENRRVEMEQHMSNCPMCSLEIEKERKFGHVLKTHFIKEKASYALREALVEQLERNKKRFSWKNVFVRQLAPSLALLLIVVTVFFNLRSSRDISFPIFSEAVENHLEYLRGIYPLEFQTSDIKEALAWFRGKTDFAVTPPHIDLNKVHLVGGRLVHLNDKKSAYFLLEKDGYKISAFYTDLHDVSQPKKSDKSGIKPLGMRLVKTEKGYHTIYCFHPEDGTACILVSDMPLEELEKLIV
jgi:mycothiol system anti-sigma-R factor